MVLHADIQLDQHHLAPFIEDAFVFPLYCFGFFVNNKVSIGVWVYFWLFSSFPLVNLFLYQYQVVFITIAL